MIVLNTVEATLRIGHDLARLLTVGDVVGLTGALGAGKTVLARGILAGLGYLGDVPSPSFPLVIPYDLPIVRIPLAHVDLYRVEDAAELDELGLDDARLAGVVIIEWPDRLAGRAWDDMLRLTLALQPGGARALTAQVPPAWDARWPPR